VLSFDSHLMGPFILLIRSSIQASFLAVSARGIFSSSDLIVR